LSIELVSRTIPRSIGSTERAVLETLAYSDIFDYPLRIEELHRYLSLPINRSELADTLNFHHDSIKMLDGYFVLAGREHLIGLRQSREAISRPILHRAIRYGRLLGGLPFIRMVGLTGSLALQNCDEKADIDYLLVAAHGRVWIARALALLLGHATALSGNIICPNLIISEQTLEWRRQDTYSAHELCQMIPISGFEVYRRIRQVNSWTNTFLPNASSAPDLCQKEISGASQLRTFFELPLRGGIGDSIETWEMNRKIKRFIIQAGYGPETQFNRDICQGNFNQHGLQIKAAYQRRLSNLGL
jgi:hypothetical protein